MDRQFSFTRVFQTSLTFLLLISICAGALTAQTARKPAANPVSKTPPIKAGWSGVITYQKALNDDFSSDEQLFGRLDKRERIKHNNVRRYQYTGRLVVNDLAGTGRATTTAQVNFRDAETHKVVQTELTNCHAFDPERLITANSIDRKVTVGTGNGEAYSYSLSVNGDRFNLSFTLPEIQGKYTHDESSTYSNLCPTSTRTPSASNNSMETRIERGGASIDGSVDPKNPDVLEGSKSWSDGPKSFTHTVTWRLRRTPQPLIITDIRFEQPQYPSPNEWHAIGEKGRAVDGNQVKIIATIANLGATDKTATVNFKELKENVALPNGPVSSTIPANGQKDVELIWDTSGYAWKQSGTDVVPEMNRQIEVTIPDDQMEKDLTVIPKPVIVVWGIWQWADSFTKFRDYFKAVNDKWGVWVARNNARSVTTDNADIVDADVRNIQKGENAWHVDMVGLQNGGLVGRVYVNSKMPTLFDGRPAATHLVMIGTPNLGTPCATGVYGLSFKLNTLNLEAVSELSPESMKRFNLLVNNTNGTKFAALAIDRDTSTCQEDEVHGDGFVPVKSAIWRVKTYAVSRANVNTMDILGEVSHFRQVYKWLAVPPKGDHQPDASTLAGNLSHEDLIGPELASIGKSRHYGAMFTPETSAIDGAVTPAISKVVTVSPGRPTEIEIPVTSGSRFSLVLFGSADVSATLIDDKGQIVGKNLVGTADALELFRTINIKGPFGAAKWKLRLENGSAKDIEIAISAFVDYTSTDFR
jgi:hypothetical protein